jgi:aryl-alcohol dehydrogenase-like predicted oxidoreductase
LRFSTAAAMIAASDCRHDAKGAAVTHRSRQTLSRRELLKWGALAGGAGLIARPSFAAAGASSESAAPITKAIPATGEKIPVIGLGTNNYSPTTPDERVARLDVLKRMPEFGGTVIDTAPAYRQSESVLGEMMAELGNRQKFFLATKVTAPGGDAKMGVAMMEESLRRLRTERVELMQVHNLDGVDELMPVLREWKGASKFRYIGVTTSSNSAHGRMMEFMRRHPLDFIQVDYSIDNRAAADAVLPLARERGIAVLNNIPFGGRRDRNLLRRLAGREPPDWAKELDARTWGQFLLKYCVSHPAVTCAIPGTTRLAHLEDNQAAGRGRLPDAALRKRMEEWWDSTMG